MSWHYWIRKDIIALFKPDRISIAIDTNLIETDFLDVSFSPLYICSIIKQLPSMTNKRISNLSCNEHEFNKAKSLYESDLKSSGFNYSMKFEAPVENATRNRNRKAIC